MKKLQEAVKTLETMDVLFSAGMRPDANVWQLHDLKLKYGDWLQKAGIESSEEPEKND